MDAESLFMPPLGRHLLAVAATLVVGASSLAAQPPRVRSSIGSRARVSHASWPGPVVGTLIAADSMWIVLQAPGVTQRDTLLVSGLRALEVSRGVWQPRARRAAVGVIVGGVAGAAIGYAAGSIAARGKDPGDEGAITVFLGTLAGTAGGAVIGGAVGAATAKERWETVWRPAR